MLVDAVKGCECGRKRGGKGKEEGDGRMERQVMACPLMKDDRACAMEVFVMLGEAV